MSIDLTIAFNVVLWAIFLESLLFFAVIMQTKSEEPGAHTGIAGCFGLIFLFQSFAALFTALCEQFYSGLVSYYFAILATAMTVLAVGVSVPASVSVAIPEPNRTSIQVTCYVLSFLAILITSLKLGPILLAAPDVPYVDGTLQREVLAAFTGSMFVLAIASIIRMARRLKGRNGALILFAGVALILISGCIWAVLEPKCKVTDITQSWPTQCPLPRLFDHNFVMGVCVLASNVLAAEGVLRLMAAGSGVEGYVEIIPIIQT